MGDTRDPETDQPAPKPGGVPVQAVLIEALKQRMDFGLKKYGRPLETHNGRDPLRDMWEEMLDMVSYFTQYILERGVELPGLEKFVVKRPSDSDGGSARRGFHADLYILDEATASLAEGDRFANGTPLIPSVCPACRHEPHAPGKCRSQALNLGCSCPGDGQSG